VNECGHLPGGLPSEKPDFKDHTPLGASSQGLGQMKLLLRVAWYRFRATFAAVGVAT